MTAFRRLPALALIAITGATLALAACGGDGSTAATKTIETKSAEQVAAGGGTGGSGGSPVASATKSGSSSQSGNTVKVSLQDNKFEPKDIKVKSGQAITFELKNEGQAVHNMKILSAKEEGKDYASTALINPEKEDKFTATFKKKGTYKFQCDYHVPDMVGTLTVE
ncbi:MAG: cupredoxin domain-containing protein [Dehalococcoidia bacterium]|nr:cupredoxin domain-containing protein [Dehalococcoidia bacterium]